MRIGYGYDVHKLVENRKLILGGIEIPFEKGLLGHSDADVLIHAIIDAILGALAKGDIGQLFPDSDENFKNIDSRILLRHVAKLMSQEGYKVGNMDATICAEKPKLQKFILQMRENISHDLHTNIKNISVKATTEEGVGTTGNGNAISATVGIIITNE
ncbi:MAG: 2-C-methyl-D-erythritol 2,4-cyclodiphosphate synthase [Candidatus Cloacimonetes bacterium]|jgi:2-C-methyl-D-erythritol 2,4-cyclodiphosphate synthase|nr:2-C-methyl-D-erythritol 2,4-cyclodiphosphate synthase [Candidatus Cloacimonadota bacterium]MBT6993981.1 2-C-methyl-D-erythritol 2,4-cyclodiphosphate synthase [Candidatus Cloacimonadota bacterium]MBT7469278.1 2-C-methyl-D-erythritol 2,4-cyclodiphosphate synthase [Candidatus Cloacimonadota bacterium]